MSDVFEEVEESLRQDKASEWWQRYGIFVWILGLGIIAAVAYFEWAGSKAREQTNAHVVAFELARTQLLEGDYAAAEAGLSDLVESGVDISPLAAQLLAQTQYEGNGDLESAAATLEASTDAAQGDGPLQRLALLKAAYIKSENMTLAELEAFLGELPDRPTAIGVLATELIAAKAFREGDFARAREEFSYLQLAANVPPGVVQRAQVALTVIPLATPADAASQGEQTQAEETQAEEKGAGVSDPETPASQNSDESEAEGAEQ